MAKTMTKAGLKKRALRAGTRNKYERYALENKPITDDWSGNSYDRRKASRLAKRIGTTKARRQLGMTA